MSHSNFLRIFAAAAVAAFAACAGPKDVEVGP